MTDYVLRSANQSIMYAAFEPAGIYANGIIQTQGALPDGGGWCLVDQGTRTYVTGYSSNNEPICTTDEYWVPLRWNSGTPLTIDQSGITIAWQSNAETPTEYPEGVTRFA